MRKTMAVKAAALLLATLVLLAGGAVVAIQSVHPDRIAAYLTTAVQTATGRSLTIAGPLELRLGRSIRMIASEVTLSNPPNSTRPHMASVKNLELDIAVLPLLRRELLVKRLVLSSPDILFETAIDGRGNLDFNPADATSAPVTLASPSEGNAAFRCTLLEVEIENGMVAWHDRATGRTTALEVNSLSVQEDAPKSDLLRVRGKARFRDHTVDIHGLLGQHGPSRASRPRPISLQGSIDGMTVTVDGTIANLAAFQGVDLGLSVQGESLGPLLHLAGLTQIAVMQIPRPIKGTARLNDANGLLNLDTVVAAAGSRETLLLEVRGTVRDLTGVGESDLAVVIDGQSLAGLSALMGRELPATGPLQCTSLLRSGNGAWTFANIQATAGDSDVRGELLVKRGERTQISGTLTANTLKLNDFTETRQPGQGPSASGGERLFSDHPLPFPALVDLDIDLVLQAGEVIIDAFLLSDLVAQVHLDGGRLSVKPFSLALAGGKLKGEALLDAASTTPLVQVHLDATQVELGKLGRHNLLRGGRSDLKVDLQGQGASMRSLMATLSGEAVLSVGEGILQNKAADWAKGDLVVQLLSALNPLAKSEDTTALACAVVRFIVRNGVATTDKGIAVRTTSVDVFGSGMVDLRSENLDLGIYPRLRKGVGISLSSPIAGLTRVRGTLSHPTLGIDAKGTLRTAASLGAAAATGGLSMLGERLVGKISADADPCQTALGRSSGARSKGQTQQKR